MKVDDGTVLSLGARGHIGKLGFTLVGRTVLRSAGGGEWSEWAVRFKDDAEATLAEANGSLTLYVEDALAPGWEALSGAPLGGLVPSEFVLTERGEATRIARFGEAPSAPKRYRYVDLSSRSGDRATIDFGTDPAKVYRGTRVELAELGLQARPRRFFPASFGVAPKALLAEVGAAARIDGEELGLIGITQRTLSERGERFTWEEYVLFHPEVGLRWLVLSDGRATLVRAIEPGLVTFLRDDERTALFAGERHRFVSRGVARLAWATGELPWKAERGERVHVAEWAKSPLVLSRETTPDEVTWSHGVRLPTKTAASMFSTAPRPQRRGE